MNKDRRTISQFASVGLGVPIVWLVYQGFADPSPWSVLNNFLSVTFIIFCPPVLLTIPLVDFETGAKKAYLIWAMVALLNVAIYLAVGVIYVGLRKKRGRAAAS